MSLTVRLRSLARNIFHRPAIERELDPEVRSYVEMLAAEKIQAGLDRDEAHREARLELGGVEQVKERVRDVRAGHLLENLLQDLRYGARWPGIQAGRSLPCFRSPSESGPTPLCSAS